MSDYHAQRSPCHCQWHCHWRGTIFCAPLLFSTLRSSGPERNSACPYSTRGSPSGVFIKFYRSATRSGDPWSMHSALWWPSRMGHHVHAFPPARAEYFCEKGYFVVVERNVYVLHRRKASYFLSSAAPHSQSGICVHSTCHSTIMQTNETLLSTIVSKSYLTVDKIR